jgi:hypothetical protein
MDRIFASLMKISLFLFIVTGMAGFYFLTTEQITFALACAKIGGSASVIFTAIAIGEVIASPKTRSFTKIAWVASMLIFQIFASLAYYFVDRKTIHLLNKVNS